MVKKKPKKFSIIDFIKILICIALCIAVVYGLWLNQQYGERIDNDNERTALRAMQKECESNCKAYGVSESELIGPTLETNIDGRVLHLLEYKWICSSKNIALIVSITRDSNGKPQVVSRWVIASHI